MISKATVDRARVTKNGTAFPRIMVTEAALNFVGSKSARFIVIDNRIHLKASRAGTVAHLPVQQEFCR
jgi:hypothetical protein